jgi:aldehyde:ferredoxin oxidoreductase
MDDFEQMKSEYYELGGWDVDRGLPPGKKLSRLPSDDMAQDLEGRGLLQ